MASSAKNRAIDRYLCAGPDQQDVTHVYFLHRYLFKFTVLHLLEGAFRRHLGKLLYGGPGFIQCSLLKIRAKKEKEGYDCRFFKFADYECSCYCYGNQQVYADDSDSQCLKSLNRNWHSSRNRGCYKGPSEYAWICKDQFCGICSCN